MSKQSYKDIQSDATARHISIHTPRERGHNMYRDADNLMPLTDTEREWLIAVGRVQHKRHSDVTYLLAVLDEYLGLSEDSELVFDLPENGCGTK